MVPRKHIELVRSGVLRDENPLDTSDEFNDLLQACRHGNLKRVQELVSAGVNLNGKDKFDYTPLIIVRTATGHGYTVIVWLTLHPGKFMWALRACGVATRVRGFSRT